MGKALDDITILDLSRVIAGPFGTSLLGDLGARILKVELPGRGDDGRYGFPTVEGVPVAFLALNRNKEGITLDMRTPEGAAMLKQLVAEVDVVVENFSAGTMDRWGLGYPVLSEINPKLIYAALSGFGQTGPYADRTSYDIIAQAMGGLMALTGFADGPPTRGGGSLGDFIGGTFLAVAILGALHQRQRTGLGQMVDVSNMDAIFSMLDNWPTVYAMTGRTPARLGNRHAAVTPYDCFAAQDGYLVIGIGNSALFRALMEAIGKPELGRDPRYKSPSARLERHAEVNEIVAAWVREHTVEQVLERLGPRGANVPCAPVMTVERLVDDPQIRAREMLVPLPHPQLGEVPVTGTPFKLSASPARLERLGPDLGEHNEAVYGEFLGLGAAELERLRAAGVI